MSPSSIFSSDSVRGVRAPRAWVVSWVAALALVLAVEGVARVLLEPVGDHVWIYWDDESAAKFGWYREQIDAGETPPVLIIGDSTGAMNLDPLGFEKSGAPDVYVLACPANYPKALQINTLPLLERAPAPKVVIVSQSPWGFVNSRHVERHELTTTPTILLRHAKDEFVVTDHVYLSRLYPARQFLARHWLGGLPVIARPPHDGFEGLPAPRDRIPYEQLAPIELRPGMPRSGFDRQRLAPLSQLRDLAVRKEFRMIVTVGPFRSDASDDEGFDELVALQREAILRLRDGAPDHVELWDLTGLDLLDDDDFNDPTHLSLEAAFDLGRHLGQRLTPGS